MYGTVRSRRASRDSIAHNKSHHDVVYIHCTPFVVNYFQQEIKSTSETIDQLVKVEVKPMCNFRFPHGKKPFVTKKKKKSITNTIEVGSIITVIMQVPYRWHSRLILPLSESCFHRFQLDKVHCIHYFDLKRYFVERVVSVRKLVCGKPREGLQGPYVTVGEAVREEVAFQQVLSRSQQVAQAVV